jgi:hypothetical protein
VIQQKVLDTRAFCCFCLFFLKENLLKNWIVNGIELHICTRGGAFLLPGAIMGFCGKRGCISFSRLNLKLLQKEKYGILSKKGWLYGVD